MKNKLSLKNWVRINRTRLSNAYGLAVQNSALTDVPPNFSEWSKSLYVAYLEYY